ncbi:hypothetical protein [Candidatus Venteria ishoeyi]|nr:hypothetical protein [Candidatus Venteria ishoeyi]
MLAQASSQAQNLTEKAQCITRELHPMVQEKLPITKENTVYSMFKLEN